MLVVAGLGTEDDVVDELALHAPIDRQRCTEGQLMPFRRGRTTSGPDFYEEYYEDLELEPVPSRRKDEMEIVEKEIFL